MEQYLRVKQEHPDAFLFFRLGDFYEMFFEDAERGAALLGLTLTSRNKQDPDPIPMCGIPWHQRETYVARLLRLGHKVALCEQLEDPAAAKGLVQRGVTEILTPGSVVGDAFLDPACNNYLGAVWPAADRLGLCLVDASTGEIELAEPAWDEAAETLSRARVAEWLEPERAGLEPALAERLDAALRGLPGAHSVAPRARLQAHLDPLAPWRARDPETWEGLGPSIPAAAAAMGYLAHVHGGAPPAIARIRRWREDDVLRYDAATARHLELVEPQPGGERAHTLWHHLDHTVTSIGARRLRAWLARPLARLEPLAARHAAVHAWIAAGEGRAAFRDAMRGLPDLERLSGRVGCAKASPRDLGALRDALARLPRIAERARAAAAGAAGLAALAVDPSLERRLRDSLVDDPPVASRDGGVIRAGADAVRDALHDLAHSGKRWIAELESDARARTGIGSLRVGYNRVFGYYLEVTKTHLDKVPADWERRQTITTAERFVTPALKAKEAEVLAAEEKLKAREHELFLALREEAATFVPALQRAADALAGLDAEAALAEAAARYGWVKPDVNDSDRLVLEQARHPVVERLLPRGEFVPNHVRLERSRRQVLLLTGPNMGGKSTYLRQIAIAVLLAQAGSYVPAARADIGLVDRLFTRVGAADRLGAGQSTFMVEMRETADILRSATPRSLVLLDEVGRGTATYDGLAIAWAVTEQLAAASGPRPRCVFATHYHELTQLAGELPRVANVHVTVKEWGDQVVFLHRIAEGAADRSYGIHVAQLAGLPASVLARAREVLAELESERTVAHLSAGARPDRRHDSAPPVQPSLFDAAPEHPIEPELRSIDPDAMTPMEALRTIGEWKRRWGSGRI
jgi:DNA mismatch repair protein MutS